MQPNSTDIPSSPADLKYHLDLSQQLGQIGSWEMDITVDQADAPQYWSDETFRILGYTPGQIIPSYSAFLNSVHPDDRAAVISAAEISIRQGIKYDREQRHLLPDGRIIVTRSVGQVIRDPTTGASIKLCGAIKDITETKEAQDALARTGEEMRTFFENIDEVLYSVDMVNYRVLQMSPACEKVYGYSVQEMTENPMKWFEVILKEDQYIIHESDPVMRRGETVVNEHRIRRKDGSIRWLGGRLTPTLDEEGTLVRIDGVCVDITARKEAEQALVDSERKHRTLLENSSDGIVLTNQDNTVLFASSSMNRITGYGPNELPHIDIALLFHPNDQDAMIADLADLFTRPGDTARFTSRFLTKEGKWIWLEGVSQNLLHEPAVNGLVTNFRDVTERMEYEKALRDANRDLKKTNDELDRFVYSVSHDLRAPLASLTGLIELTQSETVDPELLEYLVMMKQSVRKLDGFILDILDYSKNSRLSINKEEIDFDEMLEETVANLKFMSDEKADVAIRWTVSGETDIYSDGSRLRMVFSNLISNAVRYFNVRETNSFVEISIEQTKKEAFIKIADNGIGIDPKFHDKIFDMFYRVSNKSVGSGLGLYIVKEAIEKMQGSIEFSSKPGVGTEFRITLPNLKSDA